MNLRKIFKVRPGRYPKGTALFLSSYCYMYRAGLIQKDIMCGATTELALLLMDSYVKGFHGHSWGAYFDIQSVGAKSSNPAGTTSIVHAAMVGDAFFDLYEVTQDRRYLDEALSAADFITRDLNIVEGEHGLYFSYRPNDEVIIFNGSVMGAAFLSRVYSFNRKSELLDYAKKAVDFTIMHQEDDGSWAYSLDPRSGRKRFQTDFHQGFIINALGDFIHYTKPSDGKYEEALRKGVCFYKEKQFDVVGRSMWRLPWRWPIDIHHQAQGILTFAKLWRYDARFLPLAVKIATWTIDNMQDPTGYFYFQKYPIGANRISYMRWSQAWMMFSLSYLLMSIREYEDASMSDQAPSRMARAERGIEHVGDA